MKRGKLPYMAVPHVITARLAGVLVPLVTPFDHADRIDVDALEQLAADVLDAGAAGIVALATTGEGHALSPHERETVATACARVCGDRNAPLLVGAGTNDTRTTIEWHEALADLPAVSASLAVVPYYVRPSERAIVDHFALVADRSPVPVVLYNIPYRTGRGLGADSLLELAAHPNIAGVKQAAGAVDEDTLRLLAEAPAGFATLAGDDAFIAPIVLMGGAGSITASAHLETERFVALVEAARAGDAATARAHAAALLPLVRALFAEPSPAVVKALLAKQGRIPTPHVRMPLAAASAEGARRAAHAAAGLHAVAQATGA
jgi:4-hydroxy-tetrahydrodipicolinate synthase